MVEGWLMRHNPFRGRFIAASGFQTALPFIDRYAERAFGSGLMLNTPDRTRTCDLRVRRRALINQFQLAETLPVSILWQFRLSCKGMVQNPFPGWQGRECA